MVNKASAVAKAGVKISGVGVTPDHHIIGPAVAPTVTNNIYSPHTIHGYSMSEIHAERDIGIIIENKAIAAGEVGIKLPSGSETPDHHIVVIDRVPTVTYNIDITGRI